MKKPNNYTRCISCGVRFLQHSPEHELCLKCWRKQNEHFKCLDCGETFKYHINLKRHRRGFKH